VDLIGNGPACTTSNSIFDGKIGRNIDRETKCRPMIHILKTIVTPFQAIPTCFN